MKISEICKSLITQSGKKHSEVASEIGKSPVSLSNILRRDTLRASDFVKLVEALGYKIAIKNPKTGEEVHYYPKPVGKRLKKCINGVIYDTYKSIPICHSNENDIMFCELHKNPDGRYFVAQYINSSDRNGNITLIDNEEARKMIERYGTRP